MSGTQRNQPLIREAWKASASGIVAIVIFGAFINLLKFAMPMYTLQILDRIPDSRSVETLLTLTVIALLAVFSGVSLEAIRRRMLVRWSGWVNYRFGPHLVRAGIDRSTRHHEQRATRALDNLQTLRAFIEKSVTAMLDVLWVPAFVSVVFMIHPLFGAIMLTAICLRLTSGFLQHQVTRPSRQQWSVASRSARQLVASAERDAETIGAAGMARRLSHQWLDKMHTKLNEREASQNHGSIFAALNTGLYRSLYVAGMGFGVWLVIQDSLTIGAVIAVNIIMRFGFRILDKGVRRWDNFNRARKAYRRLCRTLRRLPAMPATRQEMSTSDMLTVQQLSFRYPGRSASIIRRLDLQVAAGELLCVIGRSASGKSTLARLLAGQLAPRRGRVQLGDTRLARLPAEQRQHLVGYLSDEARLFSGTIHDNISALRGGDIEDSIDAARLAGIHQQISRLPKGYHTCIDDRSPVLSAGQRRRLLLARAFFRRPPLVVLDEPAAHLDRPGRDRLIEAIIELKASNCRIIVTSQSNRLGRVADKTYMLRSSSCRRRKMDNRSREAVLSALPRHPAKGVAR